MLSLGILLLSLPPHQEALLAHRDSPPVVVDRVLRAPGDPGEPRVRRVVYGYYPYWVDQFERIRWDLLTHIAYFAVEISPEGEVTSTHGWPNTSFVETAHDFGVKVDLCFTLFSGSGISTLACSETNTASAITSMIDAMEAGGADGVNIDFEGLQSGTRQCFTDFIRSLREELGARGHPDATISIAAPAVDWSDSFDLLELARYTDVFFIMGYGYHWTGSSKAGPVGQLRVGTEWRPHISISMQRTLAFYTAQIPAELRRVIAWGAPYYGNDWPTASDRMHASTAGDGRAVTYSAARRAIEQGRQRRWDPESENPWYAYAAEGGFRQAWYEDEESLAAKYQLALEQGIGGVGMWALGYDGEHPELWDTLDAYFTEEPASLEGDRSLPIEIGSFPFADTRDTSTAPSNWFNWYGCAPAIAEWGREWVYRIDLCRAGTLEASVADGAGVDVDLHLLFSDTEADCILRDDAAISRELEPGRYLLVADSYVSDFIPQEGEYTLAVDFVPRDPDQTCGASIDLVPFEPAVIGPEPRLAALAPSEPMPPAKNVEAVMEGGCGCSAGASRSASWTWIALLLAVVVSCGSFRPK